jgi:recombination protein RecT
MSTELAVIEKQLFQHEAVFRQLVPTGIVAERVMRTVLTSIERDPKQQLIKCTLPSIIQSAMTGAVLGLEADGVTGQGFLVAFRQKGVLKAQWMTGYRGYPTLGARNDLTVGGDVVREGDEFDFELGTNPYVRHKPKLGGSLSRRLIGAYATALHPSRPPIVVIMDIDEINVIRDRVLKRGPKTINQEGDDVGFSPWNDPGLGYSAMAMKTPRRRLARSLPLTPFIMAARVDEAHEEQGKHAFINDRRELIVDDVAQPVGASQPGNGPPAASIEQRKFIIKKANGGELTFGTIEQWRAAFVDRLQRVFDAAVLEKAVDINSGEMARISDEYPEYREHVSAVAQAIEKRRQEL